MHSKSYAWHDELHSPKNDCTGVSNILRSGYFVYVYMELTYIYKYTYMYILYTVDQKEPLELLESRSVSQSVYYMNRNLLL